MSGKWFMPGGKDLVHGELYYGLKLHDVHREVGLAPAHVGQTFYITDESEQQTYSANVDADGSITNLKLFAGLGGESVAADEHGNVYIAAGQIFVYDPSGKFIETIEVPERPTQLLFGGSDRKTLFIAARSSLYAVHTRYRGQ